MAFVAHDAPDAQACIASEQGQRERVIRLNATASESEIEIDDDIERVAGAAGKAAHVGDDRRIVHGDDDFSAARQIEEAPDLRLIDDLIGDKDAVNTVLDQRFGVPDPRHSNADGPCFHLAGGNLYDGMILEVRTGFGRHVAESLGHGGQIVVQGVEVHHEGGCFQILFPHCFSQENTNPLQPGAL
jgi:hypothetical protein